MNEMGENGTTGAEGKATASMICGIVSLFGWCVVSYWILPVAIVGLVLGLKNMKSANKGFAITGIVTSIIPVLYGIFTVIFVGLIILSGGWGR